MSGRRGPIVRPDISVSRAREQPLQGFPYLLRSAGSPGALLTGRTVARRAPTSKAGFEGCPERAQKRLWAPGMLSW